ADGGDPDHALEQVAEGERAAVEDVRPLPDPGRLGPAGAPGRGEAHEAEGRRGRPPAVHPLHDQGVQRDRVRNHDRGIRRIRGRRPDRRRFLRRERGAREEQQDYGQQRGPRLVPRAVVNGILHHAPARALTHSMKSRVGTPVAPLARYGGTSSRYAVPAMSRWAQGTPSGTNSLRNRAAVIVPAGLPPVFLMSAMLLSSWRRYSSQRGSRQQRCPARSPASRTADARASSSLMSPMAVCPRAITHAPVSVAASTIACGENRPA